MDIGTSIFLGFLFLGLIWLFLKTRDAWDWKKILLYFILIPVVLTILFVSWIYIDSYISNRPKIYTSLDGIGLNENLSDVRFRNPELNIVSKSKDNISEEEDYFDGRHWISVLKGKVVSIGYICPESWNSTEVNSISCKDSSEKIFNKFGKENIRILCSNPTSEWKKKYAYQNRVYDVPKFGTRYTLNLNKVSSFSVFPINDFKTNSNNYWKSCD